MNTVIIDYDKLSKVLADRGKTKKWLSIELGRSGTYIVQMKQNPEQPEQIEKLICMVLGMDAGSLVVQKKAEATGEVAILTNLYREIQKVAQLVEGLQGDIEKIRNKSNANTIQLERIRDCVKRFEKSDCENAMDFLKRILADGKIKGEEVLLRADAAEIKRADLMKAKNDIGVEIVTTGYGKNQKTWWFIPN
ncbi:MAG: hypothetical protein H2212_12785 [Ruminococcus sp.]|nr:hypothetical protein [Ruminococcus sp.]